MPSTSHQTIKLSRGKHRSPDEGACVMELASMLADEPFSDAPKSVCPVIGAFLRTYNDRVGDDRRQDLYAYAATVVGTKGSKGVERQRVELCLERAREELGVGALDWLGRLMPWGHRRSAAGRAAARLAVEAGSATDPGAHRRALAFVDRLIAVGETEDGLSTATLEIPAAEEGARREEAPRRERSA